MFTSPTKQSTRTPGRGILWWLIFLLIIATMLCLSLGNIVYQSRVRAMPYWENVYNDSDGGTSNNVDDIATYYGHLYIALWGTSGPAARVKRYDGGTSWTQVNTTSFGDSENYRVLSLAPFDDRLYAGTYNPSTGAEVWAYNGTAWIQVNTDGFGDPLLYYCDELCAYDGSLYAGVYSNYDGCRVFRYDGGTSWTQVNNPGFGDNNNTHIHAMTPWMGYFWVGTENTTTGAEIWQYDGSSWVQENVDGFGNGDCECWSFAVYDIRLYASTGNSPTRGKVYRHNSYDSWTQVSSNGLGSNHNYAVLSLVNYKGKLYAGTRRLNDNPGCEVWSYNGSTWAQENENGFGDPNNSEATSMTVLNSWLYVCTEGGPTAQIWRATDPPVPYAVYLAEGSTDWGYSCYISIENPNASSITVKLTYQTRDGPVAGPQFQMAAESQATINPYDTVGNTDFSTKVECLDGKEISADRTMTWVGVNALCEEAHNSVGVTSPAATWYLPEGSSSWGFETYTLVQNPNDQTANVTITYMIENQGPTDVPVSVGPNSRGTWSMSEHIGEKDASIKVTSDKPVIGERAMYRNCRREGHDSVGATDAAGDYYLAEGCTGFGFTTYLLVQNPQGETVDVDITYMTRVGPVSYPTFQMSPGTRKTINVNETISLPDPNFSTQVHGSKPIIAERAMYWNGGPDNAEVCHDSIGMSEPHSTFYLPDGETGNGRETWTLVQNQNATSVEVRITYLTPTGEGNVTFTDTVEANSRKTYAMDGSNGYPSISGRAAILVESLDPEKKIMCERSMYWNDRGAGTDTVGGHSD